MSIFQAFVLGIVQGVTEFLPISSSGFLILVPKFFGWEVQSLAFDAFVHLATLAAVIVALSTDIKLAFTKQRGLLWWVVLATIPVLIGGFVLEEVLELSFRSTEIVAYSFIVWGIVLYLVDRYAKRKTVAIEKTGLKRSLAIGVAQVVALVPGTSRSGITITAGLATGLSRDVATRFSFLLGIPTIAAAGALKLLQVYRGDAILDLLPALVGAIAAFITAFLTIKFLLAFLKSHSFAELAIVRVLLGILILVI
ncbi:undecaprenyl-diphosphate phosphatase [Candidatus Uhrbacteria bacterium]|nr:undecaprenyl-diphosphate phosphatase [Candidatus Uhrbacteria bacterium]